jgi:hypothetical protein
MEDSVEVTKVLQSTDIEELRKLAHTLLTQNREMKETLRELRARLHKLSRSEEVLRAQVDYHRSLSYPARKKPTNSQSIHY